MCQSKVMTEDRKEDGAQIEWMATLLGFLPQKEFAGNLAFDGHSLECMAVNDPESVQKLRNSLNSGKANVTVESYSSPFWSLIGPEATIKQIRLGAEVGKRFLRVLPSENSCADNPSETVAHGKNGNALIRLWRRAERDLLRAEFLHAWLKLCGDAPKLLAWQIEEGWKNLLLSQSKLAYQYEGKTNSIGTRFAQTALLHARDVTLFCEKQLGQTKSIRGFRFAVRDKSIVEKKQGELTYSYSDGMFLAVVSLADGQLESLKVDGIEFLGAPVGIPSGWYVSGSTRISENETHTFLVTPLKSELGEAVLKWTFVHGDFSVQGQITFQLHSMPVAGIENSIFLPIRVPEPVDSFSFDLPFRVETSAPADESICHQNFVAINWKENCLLYTSDQSSLAIKKENGLDSVLYGCDEADGDYFNKHATVDFALSPIIDAKPFELIEESLRIIEGRLEDVPRFGFGDLQLFEVETTASISSVRFVNGELETRLFDSSGECADAVFTFPWDIDTASRVSPLGELIREQPFLKNNLAVALEPYETVTVRVQFEK